ncbi:hypothetical protein K280104A7_23270 [Candidatus Bariatricus faecipullorum]
MICRTAKFQLKELIYNPGLRYTIDSMMQTGFCLQISEKERDKNGKECLEFLWGSRTERTPGNQRKI